MLDINWNPSPRDVRQFAGLWLPLFAAVVGGLVVYQGGSWLGAATVWGVGIVASGAGLVFPTVARAVFVAWMAAAYPIGWIVSNVVLAATYYLVFAPIGFVMRMTGRDPLDRTGGREKSYWVPHQPDTDGRSYFRQF